MYLPDNLLEWCSVRACLNWKDPQLLTVNSTFGGWPWISSEEEVRAVFTFYANTDVYVTNIFAKAHIVMWNGKTQNFSLASHFCPEGDSCLIPANKLVEYKFAWAKESILEYASLLISGEVTVYAKSVQDEEIFCLHVSPYDTKIKWLTEQG
ncbi:uncharacterized protein [Oscarella lobularis]|uniref:uncharacterized protein n=1 Tax=Oscarella lobularis TaxID=121494 RepID=UPI003313293D